MQMRVSIHFHAYQPGDVILRRPGSPQSPPEFVERRSPVSLMMDDRRIRGENWTGAMLNYYGSIWKLLGEMGSGSRETAAGSRETTIAGNDGMSAGQATGVRLPAPGSPAPFCSVDIEPATLQMLALKHPGSFGALKGLAGDRVVDMVATVPFHVLLPHMEQQEQRILSRLAFSLHRESWGGRVMPPRPLGFWFPEGLYSERAGQAVVQSFVEEDYRNGRGQNGNRRMLFFVADSAQFTGMGLAQAALSANAMVFDTEKVGVFGRDRQLSDRWAFKQGTVQELVDEAVATRQDIEKEQKGIPYDLSLASDLESLAGSADQGERFRQLRRALAGCGIEMLCHSDFLGRKLDGTFPSWDGELESKPFLVRLRDHSSWSDYIDQGVGYPSDTRWTGIHRWDGLVISRRYRRDAVSQIWKQGLMKVQARLSRFVGKVAFEALERCQPPGRPPGRLELEGFLVEYHRLVFSPLLAASGEPRAACGWGAIMDGFLPGCDREEEAAWAARAYYEMLMSNRSCPRFWDHIDTRVTFQAIVFLSHSMLDLAECCARLGMDARAREAEKLFVSDLLNFREVFSYYNLGSLFGSLGWEVTQEAWQMATASEVPKISGYDVVRRAALFVALRQNSPHAARILSETGLDPSQAVADCGHIEGEMHGEWDEPGFCQNRESA